jgi:hypothetical protein
MPKRFVWTADGTALLGKMPDMQLGALLGCDRMTVRAKRKQLGIPTYTAVSAVDTDLLGTMPDARVAKLCGVSGSRVSEMRRQRGIPTFEAPDFWTSE